MFLYWKVVYLMFMNAYDVEEACQRVQDEFEFDGPMPNLEVAVTTLSNLVDWANSNSDGWHSWPKPSRASQKLQTAVHLRFFGNVRDRVESDLTDSELRSALTPVKAFLTRQNVNHELVLA